jgi:heme-degrading monooxygenase HmoA
MAASHIDQSRGETVTAPFWGCGVWEAQPGREDEFVERWRAIAEWTLASFPGAGPARLVEDPGDPTRFVSIVPWEDVGQVADWQTHPEFRRLWDALEETYVNSDRRTYALRLDLS